MVAAVGEERLGLAGGAAVEAVDPLDSRGSERALGARPEVEPALLDDVVAETLAGEAACDSTPLGSYGSSTILLKNVQKFCKNCTDKVKMDAGLYSDDQYKRITGAEAKAQMKKDLYDTI